MLSGFRGSEVPLEEMMGVLQRLIGAMLRPRVRGKARGRGFLDLARQLRESGELVGKRFLLARDTAGNREAINHIVGIERWGQRRLRVALGEPFESDRYYGYRLPEDAELRALQEAFIRTREGTVKLAEALDKADLGPSVTVRHNHLGELTPIEWLAYLDDHAWRERIRVRIRTGRAIAE